MVELPFEIITHILSFSSVESIVRFRSLSQKFCDLIESPYFIKNHLHRSIQNNTNNPTLILQYPNDHLNHILYSLKTNLTLNLQNTITPFSLRTFFNYFVWGSCNGLLFLRLQSRDDFVLFNPSTRQHRSVPPIPIDYVLHGYPPLETFGFGYDSINDDYKIIRIVGSDNVNFDSKVYSLKSNLWQNLEYPDYFINGTCGDDTWGAQVNDAIHIGCFNHCWSYFVVAFDVANTNFYTVPTPDFMEKDVYMNVDVLGGCFCLIASYINYADVWVMKVYGVKESWTKLFSVPSPEVKYVSIRLLGYSKSGDEVLLIFNRRKLIWYDLKRREIKNVELCYLPKMHIQEVCVESLVPLMATGGIGDPRSNIRKRKNEANE